MSSWIDQLKFDERGLVAVVAQEAATGEVLMLAWADREALERTLATGRAHYWSRSRGALWQKGETSGHVQEVREVRVDCDGDAVLYRVAQSGPACHTGQGSCFHRRVDGDGLAPAGGAGDVLSRIEEIVRAREAGRPEGSYTTYLFDKGVDKILKKLGEESAETIVAAKNPGTDELRSESADLLFHLLVLLRARGVPLADVYAELEGRFGAPPRDLHKLASRRPPDHS
jgi:phosphoribosyl-ATP pyrophosphohydrolase/phosphoribosyl-AMP cyclohydrolase